MLKQQDKQLFQVQNILSTLQEATEHFAQLIKDRELNQSIFMFTSIVEGSEVIIQVLNQIDKSWTEDTSKLEQYLLMVATELEKGNFIKVSEIVQFSFQPFINNLNNAFTDELGDHKKIKEISIGVFHSWANPREFYPEERINAMVQESKKQETKLYFFTSENINFEEKQITADTFKSNNWKRVTVPFPDVINNVGAGRRSHTERKLRRKIPFTSFHVGNKYTLPKRMVKHRKYTELLVPFKVCTSEKIIYDFLENNHRVVFKALGSNRGENIYFINKHGSRYVMIDQKKEQIINEEAFHKWIQNTILHKKGSYIVQRYIHTRTKEDEPYHFRAHVQKNGKGKWHLTHIYPRIGNKKSNLSNIATEGRIEDFPLFLRKEFGEKQGLDYEKQILKLSLDVAMHLDKLYGLTLDELGLDFAIDETGRIWMHEANNGPQTAFHEEKRAVHTIAYAKYIAENGVMYTDPAYKTAILKGQFDAGSTDFPFVDEKDHLNIGMLIGKQSDDSLSVTLALEAAQNNAQFYTFSPKDIDFDRGLIKGFFYENNEWIAKVTEYPDVIIDRLKLRGKQETQILYEELSDIPFTNEWTPHTSNRSETYDSLIKTSSMSSIFSDFKKVVRPRSVFRFLEQYKEVLLKPERLSYTNLAIEQLNNNTYRVTRNARVKEYYEVQLRNLIKDLIEKQAYIVQHDNRMKTKNNDISEIQIHLMKDDNEEWSFISQYAHVQTVVDGDHTVEEDVTTFIEKEYGAEYVDLIEKQLNNTALQAATALENAYDMQISEVNIIASVNNDQQVGLLDVIPGSPQKVYDENLYASTLISYASLLANEQ